MALTPYVIEKFGTLRLDVDPTEVGATQATDLQNVDFDKLGAVRARPGNTLVKNLGAVLNFGGLASYQTTVGITPHIIVSYQTSGGTLKLESYASTGGGVIATAAGVTTTLTNMSSARWGDPSNTRLYIADPGGVWRYTGAAFSRPAGMGDAQFLAVMPINNRLVKGFCNGSIPHRVWFSDSGAPETFSVNNYVDLTPGDGNEITGMAAVGNDLIVTKEDRFFVFYSQSVDQDGEPIFNYRTMEGYGSVIQPALGDEGLYLFGGKDVWLTTGGDPVRISDPIKPILDGTASINGLTANPVVTTAKMFYSNARLYLTLEGTGTSHIPLVYTPKTQTWSYYKLLGSTDTHVHGMTTTRNPTLNDTFWIDQSFTALGIYRIDPSATTDNGTGIDWSYTSGRYSPAPGQVAVTQETSVVGSGTVSLRNTTDIYGADPTPTSMTLGVSPATAEGWHQVDNEGTTWQYTLSGTGPAVVNRLTNYVSFVKPAGVR